MRDLLTGLSLHEQAAIAGGRHSRPERGEVYGMVALVSNGLARSDGRSILPGGAHPQVPGLDSGTEVYQWVGQTSMGLASSGGNAVLPGGAMVATPFYP